MERFHWLWWRRKHVITLNEGDVVIYRPMYLSRHSVHALRAGLHAFVADIPPVVPEADAPPLD